MTKKQFLDEHNRLSPSNLKATFASLTRFQEEKRPLLKDDEWSLDKLRAPFIIWLTSSVYKKNKVENDKSGYRNYPETKF